VTHMSEAGRLILENLQRLDAEERSVVGLPYAWDVNASLTAWGARVEVDIPKRDYADPFLATGGARKLIMSPDLADALADMLRESARKARGLAKHHAPAPDGASETTR